MNYLDKEKEKLKNKIKDLEEKEYEEFMNFQDTGYQKYENRRYKYEQEKEEISKFLYAEETTSYYKNKLNDYKDLFDRLKTKIEKLKQEYPRNLYPDVDHVLGRLYSDLFNNDL